MIEWTSINLVGMLGQLGNFLDFFCFLPAAPNQAKSIFAWVLNRPDYPHANLTLN